MHILKAMDLLEIILDSTKIKNSCFLCFKNHSFITKIDELMEIHDNNFKVSITLKDIVNYLFPQEEFLLTQACEDCTNLLIKMYILLHRSYHKKELFYFLINNINEKINEELHIVSSEGKKVYNLRIELPDNNIVTKEKVKIKNELFSCKECHMEFKSNELLQKHNKLCQRQSNNAIICDICGKAFEKSSTLKSHLNCHKSKQCPFCLKTLKSHSHYKLHIRNHNNPIKRKRNEKYYHCDNCNYKTLNKTSLDAHMNKTHINVRPFKCGTCQKGFFKKGNLVEHMKIHGLVKKKLCDICGEVFVNDKTLMEHSRLHTGFKPFKCAICGVGFINSGRRHEHILRKHGEKNECCIICDKKFALKKDLKGHLKAVHSVNIIKKGQ